MLTTLSVLAVLGTGIAVAGLGYVTYARLEARAFKDDPAGPWDPFQVLALVAGVTGSLIICIGVPATAL